MGALGDDELGFACEEEALALFRSVGERAGLARALNALGETMRVRGDDARADTFYEDALALNRATDHRAGIETCLHNLGYVALHRGAWADAARRFGECLSINEELGDAFSIATSLEGLAATAAAAGRAATSARLFGATEALRNVVGAHIDVAEFPEHEHFVAVARAKLGDRAFEAALNAGRQLSPADAVALARREVLQPKPPGLTGREHEIARLVARGLTNHQIAAELGVAERTVDTHVGRILRKLGVATRHEIADRLEKGVREARPTEPSPVGPPLHT